MSDVTRDLQRALAWEQGYQGPIDGASSPELQRAVSAELGSQFASMPAQRREAAALQSVIRDAGFREVGTIDGHPGTMTLHALSLFEYQNIHGRLPDKDWRQDDEPLDIDELYGPAGGPQCTAGKCSPPFVLRLAWDTDTEIRRFSCHESVAESLDRVYSAIADSYRSEDIVRLGLDMFGGCYNYRKKRGGVTLSTHAYGVAVDTDPQRNQLRWGRDRASLASEECEAFWKCWESEGWVSLGREHNFDWMHAQAFPA